MIDTVLYKYIKSNLTLEGKFKYGSADGTKPPYTVMFKVVDPERPTTLCFKQGESGQATMQFSCYLGGNQGSGANAIETVQFADRIKEQVKNINGQISDGTTTYRIWGNQTTGARIMDDGSGSLKFWGAMFEMVFNWELV